MEKTQTQPLPARFKPWGNLLSPLMISRETVRSTWRSAWPGLLLWAAFVLFLALVQFSSPDLPDNDGFYHIKLASLMRTEGLTPDFPWLPLSILNPREFYDHHFLFHVALIPFTFGDLLLGAKWAAVFFASLAFLSVWMVFKNQRIPYAWLWAAGLVAISEAFIYRMSITRAQSLSLAVLMLGVDWLLRRKYTRLAFLAFGYVWLYDAFPLLLIVGGIYVLATWLSDRQWDIRPLVAIGIGTALGLVINPYFPYNIVFAVQHILPKLVEATEVSVGNEWFPYETAQLLNNSTLALAAFISGALALGLSGKKMDRRTTFSFFLACLFGLMLLQARRFIEYFPPFALVFTAFAWTPVLQNVLSSPMGETLAAAGLLKRKKLRIYTPFGLRDGWRQKLPALALAGVLLPGLWMTLTGAQDSLQNSKPYTTFASSSAWLQANTPEGERVFQTDWDDFPRLFYYNTHNTYLIGLDPTYMQLYDAELYDTWVRVVQGKVENPSKTIWNVFGARYVVSDLKHKAFMEQAELDPGLVEVYRDDNSVVFQASSAQE